MSTAGNTGRLNVLLDDYAGKDPGDPYQQEFIVCLKCGLYIPKSYHRAKAWMWHHASECAESGSWGSNTHPTFFTTRNVEGPRHYGFELRPALSETEMLAAALEGL